MTVAFIAVNIYLLFILVTGFLTAVNTVHPHTNDEEKEFSELKDLGFDAKGYLPKVELNKFTCKSKFGYSIHCAYVLCKNSEKTVIISHGFEGNKYSCLPYVKMYLTLGYNCIIYDQRNHGDNKKTFTSLGYYESKDLETVFNKVKKVLPKQKVLGVHGISMGAACASLAAGGQSAAVQSGTAVD